MARKKTASFQNEYVIGYQSEDAVPQASHTVIARSPSEAEQKFSAATGWHTDLIRNILKTGELVII